MGRSDVYWGHFGLYNINEVLDDVVIVHKRQMGMFREEIKGALKSLTQ